MIDLKIINNNLNFMLVLNLLIIIFLKKKFENYFKLKKNKEK